jgi:glycosyltransferase involved in cell wall biosynthesis
MPSSVNKILHIITRLDMGGSAQNTLLTCHKLARKYEMVLAHGLSQESNMTDSEKEAVEDQIESARVKGVRIVAVLSLVRRISPASDILALYNLVRIIQREKPDIVHSHTSKAGILGRLAAKITKVPYIVHTPHGHVFYGHFGPLLSRLFIWIEKLFSFFIDRLITLTEGEKKDYLKFFLCSPEKLIKIHSGVDIEKFKQVPIGPVEKKRSLGLNQNGLVIGFIGWLLPIKGPMHLLKAMEDVWQDHDDTILVFIGKGDLDVELRAEALKTSANGRVNFLGWRNDIDEIMPIFDIFVLPSLNEGMGRVLVEAMAAGKPIVASKVGGIPDLVKHEYNGLLVPPGDEKALAASIKQLINDPEKAKMMGQRGRELCNQFTVEAMVEKLDNLYQELLKSHHPSLHLAPQDFARDTEKTERKYFPDREMPIKKKSKPSGPDVNASSNTIIE